MPVRRRLIAVYALSGSLSGFAALVVIARINAADSSLGEDLLLPAIAAVCLGGTSLFGGVGGIVGTAVGSLILALDRERHEPAGRCDVLAGGVMGGIILVSVLADQLGWQTARSAGGEVGPTRRPREEEDMDRRECYEGIAHDRPRLAGLVSPLRPHVRRRRASRRRSRSS